MDLLVAGLVAAAVVMAVVLVVGVVMLVRDHRPVVTSEAHGKALALEMVATLMPEQVPQARVVPSSKRSARVRRRRTGKGKTTRT